MGFFSTIWRNQVIKITPPEMRSVSIIDFLSACVHPLQTTIDANAAWDTDIRNRAKYNAQKMVLQGALNNIFATTGIIVETQTSVALANYLFNEAEGISPLYSYNETEATAPLYLYNESEAVDTYDFLIKIPAAFYTAEIDRRVRAEVNKYKLSGKTFNVITY